MFFGCYQAVTYGVRTNASTATADGLSLLYVTHKTYALASQYTCQDQSKAIQEYHLSLDLSLTLSLSLSVVHVAVRVATTISLFVAVIIVAVIYRMRSGEWTTADTH